MITQQRLEQLTAIRKSLGHCVRDMMAPACSRTEWARIYHCEAEAFKSVDVRHVQIRRSRRSREVG